MIHILNGDALYSQLLEAGVADECIICRECLVDGPTPQVDREAFWTVRANYLGETPDDKAFYHAFVKTELEKILALTATNEVNVWFENDLFCQVNLWFVLSLLAQLPQLPVVYRVFPIDRGGQTSWRGFGRATPADLQQALGQRVRLEESDVQLGCKLWEAYRQGDGLALTQLSKIPTVGFEQLPAVVQAHLERFPTHGIGRPERVLKDIMQTKGQDFGIVFTEFFNREGIYGFGDSQVKKLYDQLLST
ncbi:MAG: hypothetical protein U0Y10_05645 [Spirosomataceae bacterium]